MAGPWRNLIVQTSRSVSWVTIDRTRDRNSLDTATIGELRAHLDAFEAAGGRAVIYRGSGEKHFVGGADGVEMFELSPDEALAFSSRIQALFSRMEASPLFLVAAIRGLCFGGGLEFALACDLRLAADDARLGLPEVRLGILPGGGGTQRLPRAIGAARAAEMILGGKLYDAAAAHAMGLVTEVVAVGSLDAAAASWAEKVASLPAHALAGAKAALHAADEFPLRQGLRVESERFADCFRHPDFAERVRRQLAEGRLETTRTLRATERGDEDVDVPGP
ncbi:MAG: enoyl-CoA hydratase/isomerase family protein [Candidatus Bipolaricaulota bacterium]